MRKYVDELQRFLGDPPPKSERTFDIKSPKNLNEIIIEAVLPDSDAVKAAFAAAGLDPEKPGDRSRLLNDLCQLHYGKPKKPGPKPK
jgi:hypothetical protein